MMLLSTKGSFRRFFAAKNAVPIKQPKSIKEKLLKKLDKVI